MAQSRPPEDFPPGPDALEASPTPVAASPSPEAAEMDAPTPEQQLLARFRLHKQHRREKEARVQQTRLAAASRASRSAAAASGATTKASSRATKPSARFGAQGVVDLSRVDHHNRPHRWKGADELVREHERRAQQQQLSSAAPIRPYPGKLRGQALQEATEATAGTSTRGGKRQEDATKAPADEDDELLQLDQSQFPLHLFDSDEFEAHSPDEWLACERLGASPYFFQGEWRWRSCAIRSYDAGREQYLVQFQGSDRQKWVRRINLRFESEAPAAFERRVAAARARREEAKAMLRFDDFLARQDASQLRAMG
ncbi:hypothetical protein BBJ28_00005306, partial [Nothophytophthora sp. Chile5]